MRGLAVPRTATTGRVRDALARVSNADVWWRIYRAKPENANRIMRAFPHGLDLGGWDEISDTFRVIQEHLREDRRTSAVLKTQIEHHRELRDMASEELEHHQAALPAINDQWAAFLQAADDADALYWDVPGFAQLQTAYSLAHTRVADAQHSRNFNNNRFTHLNMQKASLDRRIRNAERRVKAYHEIVDGPGGLVPSDNIASLILSYGLSEYDS